MMYVFGYPGLDGKSDQKLPVVDRFQLFPVEKLSSYALIALYEKILLDRLRNVPLLTLIPYCELFCIRLPVKELLVLESIKTPYCVKEEKLLSAFS